MADIKYEHTHNAGDAENEHVDRLLLVVPDCCDAAHRTASIVAFIPGTYEDNGVGELGQEPRWHSRRPDSSLLVRTRLVDYELPAELDPKFCPFCASPLPEFKKREEPLGPVGCCSDGGYRCDTCGDRLRNCQCWPAIAAWDTKKAQ